MHRLGRHVREVDQLRRLARSPHPPRRLRPPACAALRARRHRQPSRLHPFKGAGRRAQAPMPGTLLPRRSQLGHDPAAQAGLARVRRPLPHRASHCGDLSDRRRRSRRRVARAGRQVTLRSLAMPRRVRRRTPAGAAATRSSAATRSPLSSSRPGAMRPTATSTSRAR